MVSEVDSFFDFMHRDTIAFTEPKNFKLLDQKLGDLHNEEEGALKHIFNSAKMSIETDDISADLKSYQKDDAKYHLCRGRQQLGEKPYACSTSGLRILEFLKSERL